MIRAIKIKAVIFDWDGVLNNSVVVEHKIYSAVLEKLKLPGLSLSDFCRLWDSDYREFEKRLGITKNKEETGDKLWFELYSEFKGEMSLFPGVKDFLSKIKKDYKIGLATGGTSDRVIDELENYGLKNFFEAVVTGDEVKKLKPDPEILILCASRLKTEPKNCVYIGDSRGDVLAARNAGMVPVSVTWGYHDKMTLNGVKPSHLADSFDNLHKIIKSLK